MLALVCAGAAIGPIVAAHAEPRRTLEEVTLRKKPGERAAAAGQLPAHTEVTVLGQDGRWLLVRANNATGYLTRTTVSSPDAAAPARVGGWSAARRAAGAAGARPSAQLAVPTDAIESHLDRPAPSAVRADLGIGLHTIGMALTSNTDGGLTNYVLAASAMAAALDVDAVRRSASRWFVAAHARGSTSGSGIHYAGSTIAFRTVTADAGVRAGLAVTPAIDVALAVGGHYDAFLTGRDNAARLPSERLFGATVGARADLVPAGSRFALTARAETLVLGSRAQTRGLEDGAASTARALWGGLAIRCALTGRLSVFGGYDFGRASTVWSGRSAREPDATHTRRIDTTQLAQVGISTAL